VPAPHLAKVEREGLSALVFGYAVATLFPDRLEIQTPDIRTSVVPLLEIDQVSGVLTSDTWDHMTLTASHRSGSRATLSRLPKAKGLAFCERLYRARNAALHREFRAIEADVQGLLQEAARMEPTDRILRADDLQNLQGRIRKALGVFSWRYARSELAGSQRALVEPLLDVLKNGAEWLEQSNQRYMARFRPACEAQLGRPLTDEQWAAASTLSPMTLVLAPAGSGKTNVIVARVATLLATKRAIPSEILILAYNKGAAKEVNDRIREGIGADIRARTFHALGYEVIGHADGRKPAVDPIAMDDIALARLIRTSLARLLAEESTLSATALLWLAHLDRPYRSRFSFATQAEYYEYLRGVELRSLNGELVRSFEECEVANFLFMNGIRYVYEAEYRWSTASRDRRDYTPDFWLPDHDIYIEHFGVRRERRPDGSEALNTAPGIDRQRYLDDMEWKRALHKRHGTKLVETFSWQKQEGILTQELAKQLDAAGVERSLIPKDRILERINELGRIEPLCELLVGFLKHFKDRALTLDALRERVRELGDQERERGFVDIFERVLGAYQQELGEKIDFADMVTMATTAVRAARYPSPFRFILVDEFQDISEGRARLLDALVAQHPGAELFCVGDDWQSIYRFAGSDVGIMQGFGKRFGRGGDDTARRVALSLTFRCSPTVTRVAAEFVQANPRQIAKPVRSVSAAPGAPIRIIRCRWQGREDALRNIVDEIVANAGDDATGPEILVLGRYNRAEPASLAALERKHRDLRISFRSIHSAKGLEADHVVVMDMDAAKRSLGFPARQPDEPILRLVQPDAEDFPFAEERRLFYVALTRAKQSVTLLADPDRPSAFVRELEANPAYKDIVSGETADNLPPCVECGGAMLARRSGNATRFMCVHSPLCSNTSPACPACGEGMPSRMAEGAFPRRWTCSSCDAAQEACPRCQAGWLVPRIGKHGPFLSCSRRVGSGKGCQYTRAVRMA
jgi:DNA helicase-4